MLRIMSRTHIRDHSREIATLLFAATVLGFNILMPGSSYAAESAQQFFGYSGGGGTSMPASCDVTKLLDQIKQLETQLTQTENDKQAQLKQIQAEQTNLKPGDEAGGTALDTKQQQILDNANAEEQAIKAQEEVIHKQTEGPSDQCKRDTVAQAVSEISGDEAFFSTSAPATLDKVDAEVAKVEQLEANLQSKGVSNKDMATIKSDVASVKTASATLRGFFSAMSAKAAGFVSQASANPIGTYDSMQGGGGPLSGVGSGAQSAAQNLVNSFTNLINLFDKLSGTSGEQ